MRFRFATSGGFEGGSGVLGLSFSGFGCAVCGAFVSVPGAGLRQGSFAPILMVLLVLSREEVEFGASYPFSRALYGLHRVLIHKGL